MEFRSSDRLYMHLNILEIEGREKNYEQLDMYGKILVINFLERVWNAISGRFTPNNISSESYMFDSEPVIKILGGMLK